MRQMAVAEGLHVHFTGAGGDIAAGKYNDGSKANRFALAKRLAAGMERAWENTVRSPLTPSDIGWTWTPLKLPIAQTAIALEDELADHNPIFLANNVYKL